MFPVLDNELKIDGASMKKILTLCFCFLVAACVSSEPKMTGFKRQDILGEEITLAAWTKDIKPLKKLRIYIDGNAKSTGLFAQKPVVEMPVARFYAQKDTYPHIMYLARPCLFVDNPKCNSAVWQEGQFQEEIIDEMKAAIERTLKKYHIKEIELIGYDGGATMALLLSTRLKGVDVKVITIAGILDVEQYALLNDVDLSDYSENPAKELFSLSQIYQVHFIGAKDKTVPIEFVKLFRKNMPDPRHFEVNVVQSATHDNWIEKNFKLSY